MDCNLVLLLLSAAAAVAVTVTVTVVRHPRAVYASLGLHRTLHTTHTYTLHSIFSLLLSFPLTASTEKIKSRRRSTTNFLISQTPGTPLSESSKVLVAEEGQHELAIRRQPKKPSLPSMQRLLVHPMKESLD